MKNSLLAKYTQEKSREIACDTSTPSSSSFDFLGQGSTYKAIFVGNWHGIQEMDDLFVKIVMCLNQFGYKDIILEKPLANEYYYNKYLETGEEKYWPNYLDPGSFKALYDWNRTLPKSNKIRIWCIDVDQNYIGSSMFLNEYINAIPNKKLRDKMLGLWRAFEQTFLNTILNCLNQDISKEAYAQIASVVKNHGNETNIKEALMLLSKWFHSIAQNDIECFLQNVTKSLMQQKKTRLDYLFCIERILKRRQSVLISIAGREAYGRSLRIIRALRDTIKMESYSANSHDFIMRREVFLKNCIERILESRKKGKFVGFFGSWHVAKSSDDGIERLGEYVTKRYGRNRLYSLYLAIYNGVMHNTFTGKTYRIPAVKGFEGVLAHAVNYNIFHLPIEESFFKKYKFIGRFREKISSEAYDGCIFIRETHKLGYSFVE